MVDQGRLEIPHPGQPHAYAALRTGARAAAGGCPVWGARVPGVVERAKCFINERHADPLTNLAIARHVGCSVSYLARAFRQQHGVTLGQQLRTVRARAGVELLEGSDLKMDVISRRVGFRGKANFYAAVRALTGKTPGDVRANRRVSSENRDLQNPRPRPDAGGDYRLGGHAVAS